MSNRITRNTYPNCFFTSPGDPQHVRFEPRFNGSSVVLHEVGREDIQQRIEAFAPYTDLNYMLSRLKVGDNTVLCSRQPIFGDFTGLPTNGIDAVNLVQTAESRFLELSSEERQKFNNDFRVWLASILHPSNSVPASKPVSGTDSGTNSGNVSGTDVEKPVIEKE